MASDQGLHIALNTGFSIKMVIVKSNQTNLLLIMHLSYEFRYYLPFCINGFKFSSDRLYFNYFLSTFIVIHVKKYYNTAIILGTATNKKMHHTQRRLHVELIYSV